MTAPAPTATLWRLTWDADGKRREDIFEREDEVRVTKFLMSARAGCRVVRVERLEPLADGKGARWVLVEGENRS